jgi:hypothetical protein
MSPIKERTPPLKRRYTPARILDRAERKWKKGFMGREVLLLARRGILNIISKNLLVIVNIGLAWF